MAILHVRDVPVAITDGLRKVAAAEDRSISAQVRQMLKEGLEARGAIGIEPVEARPAKRPTKVGK